VDTLFHEVVVAADATPRLFEKAFLLPFSAAQYEIGERSRFRITTGSDEFHAKTRTSGAQLTAFVDDPPEVAKLVQGRGLRPNKVHFLQYDRVKPPAAATPPSAANLGRGGQ
jgi:hypothetical protein